MDARDQKAGEDRVRRLLVKPLLVRGLVKPGHMKVPEFEEMLDGLCAKLAYMSDLDLAALEEEMAARPGGKDKDRFPIANEILAKASDMCAPPVGDSPLIRKVMGHAVGQRAIAEGWAPELLDWLRDNRRWPGDFVLSQIKQNSGPALRRIEDLTARKQREGEVAPAEDQWLKHRQEITDRCRRLGAVVGAGTCN
ncbi:hypothetical protein DSD19_06185 [Rhodovulum sp. BSW8]|uniref:hypothetical protein n=1 Tax=Rhodovulum sp. BSW8 TaxID=2259645 RepID=UPI000DE25740|nr:hypothetical protein [Rhodovulum sp. BSW8]RBO54048.1 hypothetical protein DSD19_06185 [Rhodovulum sp. BSW8]